MYKVLIVEDDPMVAMINEQYVKKNKNFELVGKCSDGLSALEFLEHNEVDLIVLDVYMPHMDGFETLRRIRNKQIAVEVIMVTAANDRCSVEEALHLGIVDYLVKPFGIMEMVSRVKAVLRRCKRTQPVKLLSIDGLVLNPSEHTVSVDEERVILTYKEYELLHLFLSQPGIAFTREQLLSSVWNTDYVGETRTVDMHIRTLRQKLGPYGHLIETVRNVGYRLEAKHDK